MEDRIERLLRRAAHGTTKGGCACRSRARFTQRPHTATLLFTDDEKANKVMRPSWISVFALAVASTLADASTLPASAIAANSAGIALSRDGRHAEAVHALESSLEIEPLQDATLVNLGLVWEEIGLPVKALECYGRAIDIAPDAAAPYINMGRALDAHLGERKAAIEAMEAAIRIDPTRGDAWNVLGQLHHSQGALDEAQDALARAVQLRPEDAITRTNMAKVLRDVGRFDESLAASEAASHLVRADGAEPSSVEVDDDDAPVAVDDTALVFAPGTVSSAAPASPLPPDIASIVLPSSAVDTSSSSSPALAASPVAVVRADALPVGAWAERLQRVFVTRVASEAECEWAIATAEAHAQSHGGWSRDGHHDAHPTNDLVVAHIDGLREWVRHKLATHIWPALSAHFGVAPADLWLEDCFVVKYDASEGGQPGLGPHEDDSELSFNLLLSDPDSFDGGGTRFRDAALLDGDTYDAGAEANAAGGGGDGDGDGVTVRPMRGHMLSHYGRVTHEGVPTTGGAPRYIMAGFVRARPMAAAWRELRPQAVTEAASTATEAE